MIAMGHVYGRTVGLSMPVFAKLCGSSVNIGSKQLEWKSRRMQNGSDIAGQFYCKEATYFDLKGHFFHVTKCGLEKTTIKDSTFNFETYILQVKMWHSVFEVFTGHSNKRSQLKV
ncbi:predicted protein [Histoplasma capsulatum var. duboisii H88]|uniref:Predicted protein n=1 Tax=Ajellomyces capsulatus (strain H88) TaxID=544711 RepID=F0UEX0_AJEC8|nr:predicted protein [Histoplasma capsulatum var. duboisii H88]